MTYITPHITSPYGMNGVRTRHDIWEDSQEGRTYTGPLVNILTGKPVDRNIPIEQRAAGLPHSIAIAELATRKGISSIEATAQYEKVPRSEAVVQYAGTPIVAAEVAVSEAVTIEAALAEAATAVAPGSLAPVGDMATV